MRKSLFTIGFVALSLFGFGQSEEDMLSPHGIFMENKGQWSGDFDYKVALRTGGVFFEDGGYSVSLLDPIEWQKMEHHGFDEESIPTPVEKIRSHSYRVQYLGANPSAPKEPIYRRESYRNFFTSNNPSEWVSGVSTHGGLQYNSFYPNIDLKYYSNGDQFKYDFIVHPGGKPSDIQWTVDGTSMSVVNRELHYSSPFGDVVEWEPYAYQWVDGQKKRVEVRYKVEDNQASFVVDHYDESIDLVIDPVVVFASYSGSTIDNWGFTATYDPSGALYGAGITFGVGYPTTTGVFDPNFNQGPQSNQIYIDATISKFSANGTTLLYATYYGGSECEQPHSMVVNSLGQLIVYGATGSPDLPMSANAYDNTFNGGPVTYPFSYNNSSAYYYRFPLGTDAFVAVFSPNGQNLVGATYLGGTGRDAINSTIQRNYGDGSRGEVVVDDNDNIYVITTTFSNDYPLVNSGVGGNAGNCDVGVTKFNSNLSAITWSTLYGGSTDDQGYGIKVAPTGDVYICGGTNSNALPAVSNGYINSYNGGTDGFLARLNSDGSVNTSTYIGTPSYDQAYFLDLDKNGAVYTFGQTTGNYPVTSGKWTTGNTRQFIHKFPPNLQSSIWSTAFGTGINTINLVPTAFNIDDCLNILLSGWGGQTNSGNGTTFLGGNVNNLPVTADAAQSNTDGSDFYFMSLSANATTLSYATFFGGGNVEEHVDGGTSRFSPTGEIFQAVCAGCGPTNTFPVTPGAYATINNSNNCNLGTVKFDFEVSITADADIDYTADVDTVCNTLRVTFTNNSRNANVYEWTFGNGQTSSQREPTTTYTTFGSYDIRLIAIDTICDISDTAYLTIEHDQGVEPLADFDINYTFCDQSRTVYITNNSRRATNYIWIFGNGVTQNGNLGQYSYPVEGNYTITLIAADTVCNKFDTISKAVIFDTDIPPPIVNVTPSSCDNGRIEVSYVNDSAYYQYRWEWADGTVEWDKYPDTKVPASGVQDIQLTIVDTVCNQTFDYTFTLEVTRLDNRIYIPNAFTPNSDGINDILLLKGNTCLRSTRFEIYNRWGERIFETDTPFSEFWDGLSNGQLKEDTYVYIFTSEDGEKTGHVTVIP